VNRTQKSNLDPSARAELEQLLSRLTLDLTPYDDSSKMGKTGARYLRGWAQYGTVRSVAPKHYFPPSNREIAEEAGKQGLRAVAPDFVRDLCNISAGGTLAAGPMIQEWVLRQGEHAPQKVEALVNHHAAIGAALGQFPFATMPGSTPLERVISFLKLCATSASSLDFSERGIALPIFVERLKDAAENAQSAVELALQLDHDEQALLLADSHSPSDRRGPGESELNQFRKAAEQLISNQLKRKIAEIALILKDAPEMGIAGASHREAIKGGTSLRLRRLKSPSELALIPQSSWALYMAAPGLFWEKVMNHELHVRERVTFTDKKSKQLLYALIDVSGSMDSTAKIGVALGVLLNRLQGVMKGEAELYYRFFDGGVFDEHRVRTRSEALQAMNSLLKTNFSGNSTNIQRALDAGLSARAQHKRKGLIRPDMVLITDGEDSVSQRDLGGTKLHSFFCAGGNRALKEMSRKSGGLILSLH
jgi:Mg-chelatase subunit ChlD